MTDLPDFDLDPDLTGTTPGADAPVDPATERGEPRPAEPVVVIQYRNRGLPAIWFFPLTLVLSLVLLTAYHRLKIGPLVEPPRPEKAAAPLTEQELPPDASKVLGAFAQASEALPPVPPLPLTLESQPLHVGASPPVVEPPPSKVDEPVVAIETPPTSAESVVPESSPDESEAPPLSIASTRRRDLMVEPEPKPKPDVQADEPAPPTREELMERIRQEGLLKQARQEELERRKHSASEEVEAEALARVEGERDEFRRALQKILATDAPDAGAAIDALCSRYGRVYSNELKNRAYGSLSHYKGKMSREEEVQMLRAIGVPEAGILDYLANRLHRSMRSRRGPRDADEVRVFAARQLLRIKPTTGAATAEPFQDRAETRPPSVRRTTSRRD